MANEIQPRLVPQTQATGRGEAMPAGAKVDVPQPAVLPEQKPHLTPIPKADIQFDSETVRKNLQEAIQKLNDMLKSSGRAVSFSMDVKLGRPIVFVTNLSTGEVIRQIPNEVVVRVAHGIEDFKGMLHNTAA
jgi:flagellar protein FlaG